MTKTKIIKTKHKPFGKNKHSHLMDKVKIKRVKRDKKHIGTKEKVLAGLGLGSTLLGGASAVAPKAPQTQFVRTQEAESGSNVSKVKANLKRIFGVTEAQASGVEQNNEAILDIQSKVATGNADEAETKAYVDYLQSISGASTQTEQQQMVNDYNEENTDYQTIMENSAEKTLADVEAPLVKSPTNPTVTPTTVTPAVQASMDNLTELQKKVATGTATSAETKTYVDYLNKTSGADTQTEQRAMEKTYHETTPLSGYVSEDSSTRQSDTSVMISDATTKTMDELTREQASAFVSTFENGQNQNLIPSSFGSTSAFAFALGLGDGSDGSVSKKGSDGKTYTLQSGQWVAGVSQDFDAAKDSAVKVTDAVGSSTNQNLSEKLIGHFKPVGYSMTVPNVSGGLTTGVYVAPLEDGVNIYGLDYSASTEVLKWLQKNGFSNATLVEQQRNGQVTQPIYLIQIPGSGTFLAGGIAQNIINHGESVALQSFSAEVKTGGGMESFIQSASSGTQGLLQVTPDMKVYASGSVGTVEAGAGQSTFNKYSYYDTSKNAWVDGSGKVVSAPSATAPVGSSVQSAEIQQGTVLGSVGTTSTTGTATTAQQVKITNIQAFDLNGNPTGTQIRDGYTIEIGGTNLDAYSQFKLVINNVEYSFAGAVISPNKVTLTIPSNFPVTVQNNSLAQVKVLTTRTGVQQGILEQIFIYQKTVVNDDNTGGGGGSTTGTGTGTGTGGGAGGTSGGSTQTGSTVVYQTANNAAYEQAIRDLQAQIQSMQGRIDALNNRLSQSGSTVVVQNSTAEIQQLRTEVVRLQGLVSQLSQSQSQVRTLASVDQPIFQGLQMPSGYNSQQNFQGLQMPANYQGENVQGATSGTYTVKKGDTLWAISKKYYGDGKKWRKILEANPQALSIPGNTRTLKIGAVLVIPQ